MCFALIFKTALINFWPTSKQANTYTTTTIPWAFKVVVAGVIHSCSFVDVFLPPNERKSNMHFPFLLGCGLHQLLTKITWSLACQRKICDHVYQPLSNFKELSHWKWLTSGVAVLLHKCHFYKIHFNI